MFLACFENLVKSDLFQSLYVVAFQWDPKQPRLAICTANNKLYMWSPAGCVSVVVPTEGKNIPLFVCCCFFQSNLNSVSVNKNLPGFLVANLSLFLLGPGVT